MRYLTESELNVASRFLFLSMAITVIKQDIEHIQNGAFKIKEPYLNLLNQMISEATVERRQLRKIMQDEQIQVVSLNKNDTFSSYLFISKGREEKRNYFIPAIRKKVESIIQDLLEKVQLPGPRAESSNN
ncbi:MAG TPA: hypothetical protein VK072_07190 [Candidatus Avamphibacillus sp.]|nr:hypothetical protein [Candidatus Avamphibacillus sp.]